MTSAFILLQINEAAEMVTGSEGEITLPIIDLVMRGGWIMAIIGVLSIIAFYIFFEQDSNELSPKAIEKLNRIYEILANNPAAKLALNGYSDSIGSPSYNRMVSEYRAHSVKIYLSGKRIKPSRMMAFGHGAQKFIASNKSAEGRRLNRRVEIELIIP